MANGEFQRKWKAQGGTFRTVHLTAEASARQELLATTHGCSKNQVIEWLLLGVIRPANLERHIGDVHREVRILSAMLEHRLSREEAVSYLSHIDAMSAIDIGDVNCHGGDS